MKEDQETIQSLLSSEEIDLIALMKSVWLRKWDIIKIVVVFIILGFVIAFTTPKEFKASSVLIAESATSGSSLGGLGGLASLAGVNLGGLNNDQQGINPELYQSVSQSTPFLIELLSQEYYFEELDKKISIYEYYSTHFKKSLISKILSIPGRILSGEGNAEEFKLEDNGEVLQLSKSQTKVLENLKSRVFVEMDWSLNVVMMRIEMQDPLVAAEMVQFTQEYITNYVTEYAISKSQQQLNSIEEEYQQRKNDFEEAQYTLASFRDRNKNVTSARARSEEERLQSVYNLTFNIYNQLAQQREAIKLQIQENTPVFTVLEPVRVPVEKSKPKRSIILIGFALFGGIVGVGFVLIKIFVWKK